MRAVRLLLGLVPLVGLAELGLHYYFAARAPSFDDYAALGTELRKQKQGGVPVVVAPAWAEPLVRQAAPEAFPLVELARADDSTFSSFLEVSLLGRHAPELSGMLLKQRLQSGPFELSLLQNPHAQTVEYDVLDAVEHGRVQVQTERGGGERTPCERRVLGHAATGGLHGHVTYPRARYACENGDFVGVTLIEDAAYRPRRCLLAHVEAPGALVLRFSQVPASSRFVGHAGYSYFLERDVAQPLAELALKDGEKVLEPVRQTGAGGWSRFERSRAAPADDVELRVTRLAARGTDFCFTLEAR